MGKNRAKKMHSEKASFSTKETAVASAPLKRKSRRQTSAETLAQASGRMKDENKFILNLMRL